MLPCRCTLLPPAARRPITGVIVTVRQARRWSATLLDRRTGLRQALHFWIGVYIRPERGRVAPWAKCWPTRPRRGLVSLVDGLVRRSRLVATWANVGVPG